MTITSAEAVERLRAAGSAVQEGDGERALTQLKPLVDAGVSQPQLWLIYGEAARLSGARDEQERAADRLLAIDPAQPRALAWKGDGRAAAADRRGASAWYRAALRAMAALPALPPSLKALHNQLTQMLAELDQNFANALSVGLAARGIEPAQCSPAFNRSLRLLRGEETAEMLLQRPALYFYPDLPARRFYERAEFAWVSAVEDATSAIRAELEAALADRSLFSPYLTHDSARPAGAANALTDNAAWSALKLIDNGRVDAAMEMRFPATLAALEAAPLCRISVRAPTVMFSLLQPGARIAPHHGAINARLICHLPLIIPGPGALQVGGEAREWHEGKLLIFDDSVEHAAWNDASDDRVVLIFDVWRPEVPETDRRAIAAMFETIDAFN